jgi:hypothetical protein
MSQKDRVNKEIDILGERRKDWFNVLLALASAVIVLIYSVLSGDKPIYILILGIFGFFGIVFVGVYYKKIETEINDKLKELKKEE